MTRTLSLALAALLAAAGSASAQEKFTFALNWFAVGDHAAYWVALDKGYYKAKGLDVILENSKGSGDSIAKVDTGRADAGLADAAVVIASVPVADFLGVLSMPLLYGTSFVAGTLTVFSRLASSARPSTAKAVRRARSALRRMRSGHLRSRSTSAHASAALPCCSHSNKSTCHTSGN